MARIPDEEIDRPKQEVSLQRLVEAQGTELKRHGADPLGLCPFHEDHAPSLVVSPKKNLWHCLGACQTGGSVIDWVMKSRGVSFRHAVELLRNDHPLLSAPVPIVSRGTTAAVVSGNTLHYVTLEHEEKQVPLDTVDRGLSAQLNRERHVSFTLPNQ